MRIPSQKSELKLRLDFVLRRVGNGKRVTALESLGGDGNGVLQQVDFTLRLHLPQVAEHLGGVIDFEPGINRREFGGELGFAMVFHRAALRDHVDLRFVLTDGVDGLGEGRGHV